MKVFQRTRKFLNNLTIFGDVGVNTLTPTAKLDIDGDLKIGLAPSDNNLTDVMVVDADGRVFSREVATLFDNDIHLISAIYDDNTNILTLTLSNGTTQDLDFNDLVDITVSLLQDTDGDTKVYIEELVEGDFIHVQAAGVNVVTFEKENVGFLATVKFEKGYSVALRNVNASTTLVAGDHTLIVDPTVSGIIMTLPAISSVPSGKIYELKMKNLANPVSLVVDAADTIKGQSTYNLNHSFVRFQADTANNEWILLEEVRAGGSLAEQTSVDGDTVVTFTQLIGLSITNFDFLRDGLVESGATEYTFDSVTGNITVVEAFETELLQLRLN